MRELQRQEPCSCGCKRLWIDEDGRLVCYRPDCNKEYSIPNPVIETYLNFALHQAAELRHQKFSTVREATQLFTQAGTVLISVPGYYTDPVCHRWINGCLVALDDIFVNALAERKARVKKLAESVELMSLTLYGIPHPPFISNP